MNIPRLVFITLLFLSLFVIAKSYVAVSNIQEWTAELSELLMGERAQTGTRNFPMNDYTDRIGAMQKQWIVVRYVGVASAMLCCSGIFLASRNTKPRESGTAQHGVVVDQLIPKFLHNRGLSIALLTALLSCLLSWRIGSVISRLEAIDASVVIPASLACGGTLLVCGFAWICLIRDAARGYPHLKCALASMALLAATIAPLLIGAFILSMLF